MADAQKELKIVISADASKAKSSLDGFSGTLKGIGTIAAGIGLEKLGEKALAMGKDFIKGSLDAYMGAEKIKAQLDAVLKSTDSAAGMTKQALIDLSEQLQKTTAYDNDLVLSAENMLLTFTNIGSNVFPEATKAVLDMSTALGQDTKNSAIQLGKALQDPIAGVTALQRVGVKLTEDQKEQVKSFMAVNDVMGAQNVILKELQREFGGSAEAAGKTLWGQIEKLKNEFGDFQKVVGKVIAEAIDPFVKQVEKIDFEKLSKDVVNLSNEFNQNMLPALNAVLKPFYDLDLAIKTASNQIVGLDLPIKIMATGLGTIGLVITILAENFANLVLSISNLSNVLQLFTADTPAKYQLLKDQIAANNEQMKVNHADLVNGLEVGISRMNTMWDGHKTKVAEVAMQSIMTKDDYSNAFSQMKIKTDTVLPAMSATLTANMSTMTKTTQTSAAEMMTAHKVKIDEMQKNTDIGFSGMYNTANNWWGKIKGIFDNIMGGINGAIDSLAKGISTNKKATGGFASGLTLVGERGPELVNLPQGSYVNDAEKTKGMMGGTTININNPTVRNDNDIQAIAEAVKNVLGRQSELAMIGSY